MFSAKLRTNGLWLAKSLSGCAIASYTLSNHVLTDQRLETAFESVRPYLPHPLLEGLAFATPDHGMHPAHYPWDHRGYLKTFDHSALRRGYQVYKEVCSACHSMKYIAFRNLIGVTHSEEEVKALSSEYEYVDGPNDQGEMYTRSGKPSDYFPNPYPNEEAARAVNGGAYPPDLSCITRARHGEEDYIFSLLNGYHDPPAGVVLREGLNYNPYYPGGAIAMARPIYDESVEYDDGSPNNAAQLAKDVSTFLHWASNPEFDERKRMGMKAMIIFTTLFGLSVWWKRFKWSYIKSKRIVYQPPKPEL